MSGRAIANEWNKGWSKILEYQKHQAASKEFVHKKYSGDKVYSTLVPLAMSACALPFVLKGMYNMITGTNRLE